MMVSAVEKIAPQRTLSCPMLMAIHDNKFSNDRSPVDVVDEEELGST